MKKEYPSSFRATACFLSCPTIFYAVQLMMYLQNDLLETVPLDKTQVPIPGYLGKIKRELKEKYKMLLAESAIAPEFIVVNRSGIVPKANDAGGVT